jgi:hypothetical protein
MKRVWLVISIILGLQFAYFPAQAADSKIITVVTQPNRNFNGSFFSDDLSARLAPSGDLGQLVFSPVKRPRTWVVDAALVDDVIAMKNKYQIELLNGEKFDGIGSVIASKWLNQFKFITRNDEVVVLPYGNPAYALTKNYAPGELNFYYSSATLRLATFLERAVTTDKSGLYSKSTLKSVSSLRKAYGENRRVLTSLDRVVEAPELSTLRLELSRLLDPNINKIFRDRLIKSANEEVAVTSQKLRVVAGRYRLTSAEDKLPITIVNSFSTPVKVSLRLIPRNSRIQISGVRDVSIAANTKLQLALPANVLTPGTVTVSAQLTDAKGISVTSASELSLNLSIVDSRVAWFTSCSAVLLFVAATLQTIRRVRRSRK